jgi:hypothetical protein
MKEARAMLEMKKMNADELISKFLSDANQEQEKLRGDPEAVLGQVTFQAGILENKVLVHLINVSNIKPRPNKTEVKFSDITRLRLAIYIAFYLGAFSTRGFLDTLLLK